MKTLFSLSVLSAFAVVALAGNLNPSDPPGPTMKTLDEVEPRIPIHESDLPLKLGDPGSYYLTEDVNYADTAITIQVENVTIDLSGYSLIGPDSGTNYGIYIDDVSNVEIRNGTVVNFGTNGIYATTGSSYIRVINVRAISNNSRGIVLLGQGNLVRDCFAGDNGDHGIYAGYFSTVTGNVTRNNGNYGIFAGSGCTFIGNTASGNGGAGIATSGSTVKDNTSRENGGRGIEASNSTISGNTVSENGDSGIYAGVNSLVTNNTVHANNNNDVSTNAGIKFEHHCIVKGNNCISNLQNNIYVWGYDNTIEENLVTGCSGYGIYFRITGSFYANNRAAANGTDYGNTAGNTDGGGNVSF
jgi:parallel beta-helix repeat protein